MSDKITKVFIPNRSAHDFSNAKSFGDLMYLSTGMVNRYSTSVIYRKFSKLLENSKPHDYILLTGLIELNILACCIMAVKHGKINLLLFQAQSEKYVVRTIRFDNYLVKDNEQLIEFQQVYKCSDCGRSYNYGMIYYNKETKDYKCLNCSPIVKVKDILI